MTKQLSKRQNCYPGCHHSLQTSPFNNTTQMKIRNCISLLFLLSALSLYRAQVTGLFLGDAVSAQAQMNQNRYFAASIPSTSSRFSILLVDVVVYAKLADNTNVEVWISYKSNQSFNEQNVTGLFKSNTTTDQCYSWRHSFDATVSEVFATGNPTRTDT